MNVQPESGPVTTSARIARASREAQSDALQREAAHVRAIRRRQQRLEDLVNMVGAIRIVAPTCGVNAHLKYVNGTGIDVWNIDPKHVINIILDFTKPDINMSGTKLVSLKMPSSLIYLSFLLVR